jgi:hypothetical protein
LVTAIKEVFNEAQIISKGLKLTLEKMFIENAQKDNRSQAINAIMSYRNLDDIEMFKEKIKSLNTGLTMNSLGLCYMGVTNKNLQSNRLEIYSKDRRGSKQEAPYMGGKNNDLNDKKMITYQLFKSLFMNIQKLNFVMMVFVIMKFPTEDQIFI